MGGSDTHCNTVIGRDGCRPTPFFLQSLSITPTAPRPCLQRMLHTIIVLTSVKSRVVREFFLDLLELLFLLHVGTARGRVSVLVTTLRGPLFRLRGVFFGWGKCEKNSGKREYQNSQRRYAHTGRRDFGALCHTLDNISWRVA